MPRLPSKAANAPKAIADAPRSEAARVSSPGKRGRSKGAVTGGKRNASALSSSDPEDFELKAGPGKRPKPTLRSKPQAARPSSSQRQGRNGQANSTGSGRKAPGAAKRNVAPVSYAEDGSSDPSSSESSGSDGEQPGRQVPSREATQQQQRQQQRQRGPAQPPAPSAKANKRSAPAAAKTDSTHKLQHTRQQRQPEPSRSPDRPAAPPSRRAAGRPAAAAGPSRVASPTVRKSHIIQDSSSGSEEDEQAPGEASGWQCFCLISGAFRVVIPWHGSFERCRDTIQSVQ